MPRFLKESDYAPFIKPEIKVAVTGTAANDPSAKQLAAEETAVAMITEYIGGRYDCTNIFSRVDTNRNSWIIKCVIVITLYNLYQQTGMKDIPEHRVSEYDDVIKWLEKVGAGVIPTTLPEKTGETGEFEGDFRLNSRKPENHKW